MDSRRFQAHLHLDAANQKHFLFQAYFKTMGCLKTTGQTKKEGERDKEIVKVRDLQLGDDQGNTFLSTLVAVAKYIAFI